MYYYYIFNAQGDVIGILDSSGNKVVTYDYNAWGSPCGSIYDSTSNHIGTINPIRYRGYYYDTETGFYYLQARYYDPTTRRFINADGQLNDDKSILGANLFAYCYNNPVNMVDYDGQEPKFLSNRKLLSAQNISVLTRLKSIFSASCCLKIIYKYDSVIEASAIEFNIPANMIRAILYKEIMCVGFEDLLADQTVRNYYEGRSLCIKMKESSTGLAQIRPSTAIKAEKIILKCNTTTDIWEMWNTLQDPETNIYYCAMVLRMGAKRLGYVNIGIYDYNKIKRIFARYNGSVSYGVKVLANYKEFLKG